MNKPLQIILKSLVLIALTIYCIIQGLKGGDFRIYLGAADLLAHTKSCYGEWIHLSGDNYGQYSYSPFFAVLLIPFTWLPSGITEVLWLFLNLFLLKRSYDLISSYLDFSSLKRKQIIIWQVLSLALIIRFILHNFEMVQMTIFLLYCCLESLHQAENKRYFLSALFLSLGIIIKVLPLVMIPYSIYRKIWKPLPYIMVLIALYLLIPALFFGWDFNLNLHAEWWEIINPTKTVYINEQNKFGEGVHSLSGLLAAYFSDTPTLLEVNFKRTISVLSTESLAKLLTTARLLLIAFTLYFLRSMPFQESKNSIKSLWELAYLFSVVPLLFPHQQKYAFYFMAPAVMYLAYFLVQSFALNLISRTQKMLLIILTVLFFVLTTLTTDGIIGNYLNDLSEYYKTITFGAILLLIILSLCNPKKLRSANKKTAYS